MKVTVLSGGVGGARFTRGLLAHLRMPDVGRGRPSEVTVIANTGDDLWLHGVRVCPDLDTLMYTLGGVVHEEQGWGRRGESSHMAADLAGYDVGGDWFTLGDLDLATHLARTQLLREGLPLSQVTERLCRRWQPGAHLLPMSDQEVETHVVVDGPDGGEQLMHFEEWWVRHRAAPAARRFVQVGLDTASAGPGVLAAVLDADVVILPPSNPVVSVGTILAVPGVRAALEATTAPVVGISPIVGGAAVRGMADQCLRAIGVETSAAAVARHYGRRAEGGVLDAWLVDTVDAGAAAELAADGWRVGVAPTLMTDVPATARIAAAALALVLG
ncbi:2-phospho-L-lactate transferase [Pengzhenrongella frigida]|uniref:2-phospho-L-lactate transferase n=1 Tax=Pengzhenrongella frigida TaxID=1259133 RepID=A0A4Q5N0X8_9MICO|nr:2-phospho-L-lactate transferase [Cellulomonas sp. HLT2-17]RYV51738.1 2-phospho-L-lactate transferase [Cellulomonas sp. HLT2-17]